MNFVCCADIIYISIKRGFLYLLAIMDWHSRKVLSWRLSNTMGVHFCMEALDEALEFYDSPEIFNTDQEFQFISIEWVSALKAKGVKVSMDGKGRWIDNVFIERLWRSLKYESVYLNASETGLQARRFIDQWINHYNKNCPHSSFNGKTPNEVYYGCVYHEKIQRNTKIVA